MESHPIYHVPVPLQGGGFKTISVRGVSEPAVWETPYKFDFLMPQF
jgi:hypothetical protein